MARRKVYERVRKEEVVSEVFTLLVNSPSMERTLRAFMVRLRLMTPIEFEHEVDRAAAMRSFLEAYEDA